MINNYTRYIYYYLYIIYIGTRQCAEILFIISFTEYSLRFFWRWFLDSNLNCFIQRVPFFGEENVCLKFLWKGRLFWRVLFSIVLGVGGWVPLSHALSPPPPFPPPPYPSLSCANTHHSLQSLCLIRSDSSGCVFPDFPPRSNLLLFPFSRIDQILSSLLFHVFLSDSDFHTFVFCLS